MGTSVQVKMSLFLTGGHRVELTCDDADPVVLGLISALPGATLDAALPEDGLIQVESHEVGRRLFVTRQSLVGVELRTSDMARAAKSLARLGDSVIPMSSIPEGSSAPSPAVLFPNLLAPDVLAAALDAPAGDAVAVRAAVSEAIDDAIRRSRGALGVPDFLPTTLHVSVGQPGAELRWPAQESDLDGDAVLARALACLLVVAPPEEPPSRLRLHDRCVRNAVWMRGPEFRDFALLPNTLAVFPGNTHFEWAGSGRPLTGLIRADLSGL